MSWFRPLLVKEYHLNKKALGIFVVMITACIVFMIVTMPTEKVYGFHLVLTTFMVAVIPVTVIAREDKLKAQAFGCSLPVNRGRIVTARYLMAWMVSILSLAWIWLLYLILPGSKVDLQMILSPKNLIPTLLLLALLLSMLLPFVIRFGATGLVLFLLFMQVLGAVALFIGAVAAEGLGPREILTATAHTIARVRAATGEPGFVAVLIGLVIAMNGMSYLVSRLLFLRKEL